MLKSGVMRMLLFLLLLLCGASAYAHGSHPGERKEEEVKLVHPLEGPGAAEVLRVWRDVAHNYDAGRFSDMLVELDKLRQAQIDAGIRNLTPASSALVGLASQLLVGNPGEHEMALNLARYAEVLSPDLPDYHFARSNLLWRHDKMLAGEYVSEFLQGVRLSLTHLPSLQGVLVGIVAIVWVAGFLVMAFFSIIMLIRHLRLFSHDFGHFLPKGLSDLQRNIIGFIVLFVPFLLDLGLVPLFALWWVALWAYQARSERVVTVLMVLFVYLWPLLNTVMAHSMLFTGSVADQSYRCYTEMCTFDDVLGLELQAEGEGGGEGSALYAAASAYTRDAGRSTQSMEAAFALFKRGARDVVGPRQEDFVMGLGNVFFVKGMQRCNRAHGNLDAGLDDFQSANKYYDTVLASDGDHWGALYNQAKVKRVLGSDPSEVNDLTARAQALAGRQVGEMEERSRLEGNHGCTEEFNVNRELAVGKMAMPLLWADSFGHPGLDERVSHLPVAHDLLLGPFKTWMLALLATAVLLAVIALTIGRRYLRPATRCMKCNEISCAKCRPELSGTGLCNQCVYYRIRSSYVDPKETWLREKRIENAARFRNKMEAFLTFFLPGAGHLLRGRSVRGVLLMWTLLCALGAIFAFPVLTQLAAPPLTLLAVGSVVGTAFWSLIAFVVYFLSLIDIYSWR